jgi:hypothetical protein
MDLFSKRKKAAENPPAAYRYDLPEAFRNQVVHIWVNSIGFIGYDPRGSLSYNVSIDNLRVDKIFSVYTKMGRLLCEEHGLIGLEAQNGPCRALGEWFLNADTDTALDIIEVSFQMIGIAQQDFEFMSWVHPDLKTPEAIAKLNQRFQEHAIGFRLEGWKIVRIDSEFLHTETTESAFRLLYSFGYEGALEEFQMAHRYFRNGSAHFDDCLTNCLKALESTLQKIIELREWDMPGEAKFDNLFAEVKKKGLFPPFLGSHLGDLKKFLQTVAVIRNMEGAHGAGSVPNEVPEHLVAYQIHLTGSAIVFLIRCNEEFGKRKK